MTLSSFSVVQQIPKETKHRDIISCSTSNNSSQAQEFNLPDAHETVRAEKRLKLKASGVICSEAWSAKFTISPVVLELFGKIPLFVSITVSGLEISRTFIFHQICRQVTTS